jgi:hypothetical protein
MSRDNTDTLSSAVPHRSFSFGGKSGTTVCTVAFQKTGDTSVPAAVPSTNPMYISIDVSGNQA